MKKQIEKLELDKTTDDWHTICFGWMITALPGNQIEKAKEASYLLNRLLVSFKNNLLKDYKKEQEYKDWQEEFLNLLSHYGYGFDDEKVTDWIAKHKLIWEKQAVGLSIKNLHCFGCEGGECLGASISTKEQSYKDWQME
jgi:hypothetical protein